MREEDYLAALDAQAEWEKYWASADFADALKDEPAAPEPGISYEEYRALTAAEDEEKRRRFTGETRSVEVDPATVYPVFDGGTLVAAFERLATRTEPSGPRFLGVKPKEPEVVVGARSGYALSDLLDAQQRVWSYAVANMGAWPPDDVVAWSHTFVAGLKDVLLPEPGPRPLRRRGQGRKQAKPSAVNDLRRSVRRKEWWV